jgi:magnesium transporter
MAEKKLIEKIRHQAQGFSWINIKDPQIETIEYLKRNYNFHRLDLEDCLSQTQRPKIDDYEKYMFMVLHIPVRTGRRKYVANSEVKIFISENFLITLHKDNHTIHKIFEDCKKKQKVKNKYMGKGTGYLLYMLIDALFQSSFTIIDILSRNINELEKEVFGNEKVRDMLKDILWLKKDIINFRRLIMPQRAIIAQLEHKNKTFLPHDLNIFFDDVVDKIEKIWGSLESQKDLAASLHETNESLISHNTNNVIKVLTIFSVIMLPLTFITGFYGMNVQGLPFAEMPASAGYVGGLLVFVVVTMFAYFRYKKWL